MSIGNAEYCELTLSFLLQHGIYGQVIHNHMHHPYLRDNNSCSGGPINSLFEWTASPEGHVYWSNINTKVPNILKDWNQPTVIEVFNYLLQTTASQPYEFW